MATRAVQQVAYFMAFDFTNNVPKTGDSANITTYWNKDGTNGTTTNAVAEVDSTNCKGQYKVTLTSTETDCLSGCLHGKSTTSGIYIIPLQIMFVQVPNAVAGAAGGLFIAGTNAATTITTALTTTFTGNLTGSAASVTGAVGSVTGAVGSVTGAVGSIASGGITDASFAAGTGKKVVRANTAAAGGASTVTLDASASSTDSIYNGLLVYLTGGTGSGQVRVITGYVGGTQVATVDRAWQTNPDNTSTFALLPTDSPKTDSSLQVVVPSTQKVDVETIKTNPVVNAGTITFPTTATLASTTNITAGTITTVTTTTTATNLTNAPTAGDLTATMKTSVTTAASAATPALSAAGVQAIWDALTSALTTVGSVGKWIVDKLDVVVSTRTKPADTQAAVTLVTTTTNLTNAPTAGDLTATMKTSVKTQVTDGLNVDTYAPPTAVPNTTASLATKITWLFTVVGRMHKRTMNKTTGVEKLRNAADAADIASATDTDDGTTTTLTPLS